MARGAAGTTPSRNTILPFLLTAAIALVAVFARRPLKRPTLARVRVGDVVATQDDHVGIVAALDGGRALLALEPATRRGTAAARADLEHADHDAAAPRAGIWVQSALLGPVPAGASTTPAIGGAVLAHPPPARPPRGANRMARLGTALVEQRKQVVLGACLLVVAMVPLSGTVIRDLSTGGFVLPSGEAMHVEASAGSTFHAPPSRLVVLVHGLQRAPTPPPSTAAQVLTDAGATPAAAAAMVARRSAMAVPIIVDHGKALDGPPSPHAVAVASVGRPTAGRGASKGSGSGVAGGTDAHAAQVLVALAGKVEGVDHVTQVAPPMLTVDHDSALLTIGLDSTTDADMTDALDGVQHQLRAAGLDHTRVAGGPVFARDVNEQMQHDLHRAELLGVPAALLVLLLVFGSATSAFVALTVGLLSVTVSLALIHVLALTTEMSIFVFNIAALLGFGLGIDYSMLVIDRFRRELRAGTAPDRAVVEAVTRAGPAVLVSALAVGLGLLGMFAFDLPAIRSIALGGSVTVAATAACALLVLPGILAVLGHRIERFTIRPPRSAAQAGAGWRRIATAVVGRSGLVVVVVGGLALLAAVPATHAHLELANPSVLPAHLEARRAPGAIEREFPVKVAAPILVLAKGDATPAARSAFLTRLRALPDIGEVAAPTVHGASALYVVTARKDAQGGPAARTLVKDIRALDSPARRVTVGGRPATDLEFFQEMRRGMPLAILIVLGSSFLVLLAAFRSIFIPLKAIALDVLSICATIGIVVTISSTGILGPEAAKVMDASLPLLLFCLLFGMSMDYEVFMLARITENWQRGMDSDEATVDGLAAVAPLVTGAALILIVLGLSFATTELVLVRQVGIGVAVAFLLDATVVRGLLVPAAMGVLGDRNWWVPAALARRMPRPRWD